MLITIRGLHPDDAPACDAIIQSLPEWFGHEGGRLDCAAAVRTQRGLVAEQAGEVLGFVTWETRTSVTVEATWMAVHRRARNQGVGTRIIEALAVETGAAGYRLLLAMTAAPEPDRSQAWDSYEETRAFWQRRGFLPVGAFELAGWETNTALLMVRLLTP